MQAIVGTNNNENNNEIYDQMLNSISNDTLIYDNLISSFIPLLYKIVLNKDEKYNSIILQRTCVLCLCKLMVISEKFCKENIQLLFTILLKSTDTTIKCNIIISLGDLVFRYPNILEQYTSSIYSGLKDEVFIYIYKSHIFIFYIILLLFKLFSFTIIYIYYYYYYCIE